MSSLTAGTVRRMLTNAKVDGRRVTITTFSDHVKISGPQDARGEVSGALLDRGLSRIPFPEADEWRWRWEAVRAASAAGLAREYGAES